MFELFYNWGVIGFDLFNYHMSQILILKHLILTQAPPISQYIRIHILSRFLVILTKLVMMEIIIIIKSELSLESLWLDYMTMSFKHLKWQHDKITFQFFLKSQNEILIIETVVTNNKSTMIFLFNAKDLQNDNSYQYIILKYERWQNII